MLSEANLNPSRTSQSLVLQAAHTPPGPCTLRVTAPPRQPLVPQPREDGDPLGSSTLAGPAQALRPCRSARRAAPWRFTKCFPSVPCLCAQDSSAGRLCCCTYVLQVRKLAWGCSVWNVKQVALGPCISEGRSGVRIQPAWLWNLWSQCLPFLHFHFPKAEKRRLLESLVVQERQGSVQHNCCIPSSPSEGCP